MRKVATLLSEHAILVVAALAALITILFVPPDNAYFGYIDWKTIFCLFSVLAVANAFRFMGAFDRIARMALEHLNSMQTVVIVIVAITALLSMVATNDLALLVMLPLAATTLIKAGWYRIIPIAFTLQSIAANLCGMVVPFGNPQNLYLYSYYSLGLVEFLQTMTVPFLIAFVLIAFATLFLIYGKHEALAQMDSVSKVVLGRPQLGAYAFLSFLTLLAVFRIIPAFLAVIVIVAVLLYIDPRALKAVDYPLLLTFLCFFIFAGNMARLPILSEWLTHIMTGNELLVSAGLSQFISNVPAAVLLSHFTENWQMLLIGVNIGGVGTPIGSLASLITIKYFFSLKKTFPVLQNKQTLDTHRFLGLFCILNVLFLVALFGACAIPFIL